VYDLKTWDVGFGLNKGSPTIKKIFKQEALDVKTGLSVLLKTATSSSGSPKILQDHAFLWDCPFTSSISK
jgi:hypothetical protein